MPYVYRVTDSGAKRVTDDGVFRIIKAAPNSITFPVSPKGDIATIWGPDGTMGDWSMSGPLLLAGGDLVTALLISLFTDRISNADDAITDGSGDPRGWWGDAGQSYPIGSRLWLLERARLNRATAINAKNYITEAVQWMIDDGVVEKFDVATEIQFPSRLNASIIAYRQNSPVLTENFAWVWSELDANAV